MFNGKLFVIELEEMLCESENRTIWQCKPVKQKLLVSNSMYGRFTLVTNFSTQNFESVIDLRTLGFSCSNFLSISSWVLIINIAFGWRIHIYRAFYCAINDQRDVARKVYMEKAHKDMEFSTFNTRMPHHLGMK